MIKKILFITFVIIIFVFMLLFNNNNSDLISIDLEFIKITTTSSIMFVVIFVIGWALGILSSLFYVIKLLNQRRVLRSELKNSVNENSILKNKPLQDAD
tara:strand:+ start:3589 stop:3885 length:297 start_codon:yes stop_codon:yes gene_type:complete